MIVQNVHVCPGKMHIDKKTYGEEALQYWHIVETGSCLGIFGRIAIHVPSKKQHSRVSRDLPIGDKRTSEERPASRQTRPG